MSDVDELHNLLGLHDRIEIIYIVDGYQACFLKSDREHVEGIGEGETIDEALRDLNNYLVTKVKEPQ